MSEARKYKALDLDEVFIAESAPELVSVIRDALPHIVALNDADFMKELAESMALQSGVTIRFDTAENFVQDLIDAGFIKEVGDVLEK